MHHSIHSDGRFLTLPVIWSQLCSNTVLLFRQNYGCNCLSFLSITMNSSIEFGKDSHNCAYIARRRVLAWGFYFSLERSGQNSFFAAILFTPSVCKQSTCSPHSLQHNWTARHVRGRSNLAAVITYLFVRWRDSDNHGHFHSSHGRVYEGRVTTR